MLTIEEKALAAAREKNAAFVVKTISASGGCCDTDIREIVVELHQDFKGQEPLYSVMEYEGVKVFIERYLKVHEDILVYQRFKLPLIGGIFKVKGIEVKYI